jgi:hypothetical protein
MKYFTPELIEQLNSPERAIANAADAEWDRRLEEYEAHLQRLAPKLPEHLREFNQLLLHDARVREIARSGEQFLMILRKDIPPCNLVILTYLLLEDPSVDREALPPAGRSPVMDFLYDEFDLEHVEGQQAYRQSILFSNGWEIRLRFRDVRVILAEPIFPAPRPEQTSTPTDLISQSA